MQEGGNIGYGITPSRRRQGYGRLILALALEECRRIRLERVLVTALAANLGSVRIIEANGGRLEDEIDAPSGDGRLRRYWIKVPPDG
jgi:predicted acetyltransferase